MRRDAPSWPAASLAGTAVLLAFPAVACAHEGAIGAGGFASGFAHPISGLDHAVAMIAVGIWGAQLGRPSIWLLPVTFPLVMAVGGFLGLIGMVIPGAEIGVALSAIVLGFMVLAEARLPLAAAMAIVAVFAVFHGYAHGSELPENQSALWYSVGFVLATGMLHLIGVAIGTIHRWKPGRAGLRLAGAVVIAAGVYFLWGAVA